jgi:hypothetical protein
MRRAGVRAMGLQPRRGAGVSGDGSVAVAVAVQTDADAAGRRVRERAVAHGACVLTLLEAAAGHYAAAGQVPPAPPARGEGTLRASVGPLPLPVHVLHSGRPAPSRPSLLSLRDGRIGPGPDGPHGDPDARGTRAAAEYAARSKAAHEQARARAARGGPGRGCV